MTTEPISGDFKSIEPPRQNLAPTGLARRVVHRILHEVRQAIPPTLFFFIGFNFIVLTTNLLVAQYLVAVSSFMLATMSALIVGKAVLVANNLPIIRLFDRAPLIQPVLFKTSVYWAIVFLVRLVERFVHFMIEGNAASGFAAHLITTFEWRRFLAISLWLFVLFFIYVTVAEFSQLFGPGEIRRLIFTSRPSDLQLNRRQRARELLRLSRLTDEHSTEEFREPGSSAHRALLEIIGRLARSSHGHGCGH
jgi:hypothetical protein